MEWNRTTGVGSYNGVVVHHSASPEGRVDQGQRLSFTLPPELDARLRTFAAESERSLAAVVRLALRELLADNPRRADDLAGLRRAP